jgi:hypothetical protein
MVRAAVAGTGETGRKARFPASMTNSIEHSNMRKACQEEKAKKTLEPQMNPSTALRVGANERR